MDSKHQRAELGEFGQISKPRVVQLFETALLQSLRRPLTVFIFIIAPRLELDFVDSRCEDILYKPKRISACAVQPFSCCRKVWKWLDSSAVKHGHQRIIFSTVVELLDGGGGHQQPSIWVFIFYFQISIFTWYMILCVIFIFSVSWLFKVIFLSHSFFRGPFFPLK